MKSTSRFDHVFDHIVVGAGVIGFGICRAILESDPKAKVLMLEKEETLGRHSSGRNSGVLHSGIYYPPKSLKAKFCSEGRAELHQYCKDYSLPLREKGKVIVPLKHRDQDQISLLLDRAERNGVRARRLPAKELARLEPDVCSTFGDAIYVLDTAVVSPKYILNSFARNAAERGVQIQLGQRVVSADPDRNEIATEKESYSYGKLWNSAGLYADRLAHCFGVSKDWSILPFKGIYHELSSSSGIRINHLIYPVPDLNVPFLGVHFTPSANDKVYIGPSAVPAWSRENYQGFQNFSPKEAFEIGIQMAKQYRKNRNGFRRYAHQEGLRSFKPVFTRAARALVPKLKRATSCLVKRWESEPSSTTERKVS